MIKYSGLCIGGPMDGEWKASYRVSFDVVVRPPDYPWPAVTGPTPIPTDLSFRKETYRHVSIPVADKKFGIWISEDSPMRFGLPWEVLDAVLAQYTQNAAELRKYKETFGEI